MSLYFIKLDRKENNMKKKFSWSGIEYWFLTFKNFSIPKLVTGLFTEKSTEWKRKVKIAWKVQKWKRKIQLRYSATKGFYFSNFCSFLLPKYCSKTCKLSSQQWSKMWNFGFFLHKLSGKYRRHLTPPFKNRVMKSFVLFLLSW